MESLEEMHEGRKEERIVTGRFNDTRVYVNGQIRLVEESARLHPLESIEDAVKTFSGDVQSYVDVQREGLSNIGDRTYLFGVSEHLLRVSQRRSLETQRFELLYNTLVNLSGEYSGIAYSIDLR